ncbi:DUF4390 domain-containing protein [Ramlibacter sp. PS4R-6]|uniref:DUF4390 domain-containing protein n=1 Tax=Ramlibacter sp. PS4R-6 TaxID=3133438 RepID=UPI0030B1D3B2
MTTTDSSTPCWRSAPLRRLLDRGLARAFAFLVALCLCSAAAADTAEIALLRVERTEDGVMLSATVNFDLPAVIDDALTKGIPMYFVAEATLLRDRWYWYDKPVATTARHMRLSYQPLTRRWRLVSSPTPVGSSGLALGQTFDSRDEALAAIQRISHWKIGDAADIDPDARYNVDFRFRLDVSQLPRPFQIGAVGHSDWSINAARNVRLVLDIPK